MCSLRRPAETSLALVANLNQQILGRRVQLFYAITRKYWNKFDSCQNGPTEDFSCAFYAKEYLHDRSMDNNYKRERNSNQIESILEEFHNEFQPISFQWYSWLPFGTKNFSADENSKYIMWDGLSPGRIVDLGGQLPVYYDAKVVRLSVFCLQEHVTSDVPKSSMFVLHGNTEGEKTMHGHYSELPRKKWENLSSLERWYEV